MMDEYSPYGELVRYFDQGKYVQGRDVIEAFESSRGRESPDGGSLSHMSGNSRGCPNVGERVGYRQIKALILLHVYGRSDMHSALGIPRGVPLHGGSVIVSKRMKEFTKLVHPDKVHQNVKNREAVHEAFLILQEMKQGLHLGCDDGPYRDAEGVQINDGYEWWSVWDAEEEEEEDPCGDLDVKHLESLSVDALRDEVRAREEALWSNSRDSKDELRRQRLLRARDVLSQAVDDERQRTFAAVSYEGGFLP